MRNLPALFAALTTLLALHAPGLAQTTRPQELDTIKLTLPVLDKGLPLMQALKQRQSVRDIADSRLSPQQLSDLLWAADGTNRQPHGRTAPSAVGRYPIDIYVVLPEGIYTYSPEKHELTPVVAGDFRKQAGVQDYVFIAPLNLIYIADLSRFDNLPAFAGKLSDDDKLRWASIEAGCQVQNVYLYCASSGLGATVRTLIPYEQLTKTLNLKPTQKIICAQTVGNRK